MSNHLRLAAILVAFAIPALEIALLIKVGQWLGLLGTLVLIVISAVIGMRVLATVGPNLVRELMEPSSARSGTMAAPMLDAAVRAMAGMMLIVPGFISDAVGLVLLIPSIRHTIIASVARFFRAAPPATSQSHHWRQPPDGQTAPPQAEGEPKGVVIEGEFERLDERPLGPKASGSNTGSGKG